MKRFYRNLHTDGLLTYEVSYKETDMLISACEDMKLELFEYVRKLRSELDGYISYSRDFLTSLKPVSSDKKAPSIAKDMIDASKRVSVGPMAGVAGAFAQYTGKFILRRCSECIVENGGDIFLKIDREPTIGAYAQNDYFKSNIAVKLKKSDLPYGICSSSAKIGPSLSLGRADLAMIVSNNAVFSDCLATKTANMINEKDDITKAIEFAKEQKIIGCLFVKDDAIGLWGDMTIV